jgi:sec-independent protein translocase protein TatC
MALDQVDIDDYEVGENGQLSPKNEKEMSFLDHLEELRWHIIRSLVVVILLTLVVFIAKDFVFGKIILGPARPDFPSYVVINQFLDMVGLANPDDPFGPNSNPILTNKTGVENTEGGYIITVIQLGEAFLTHIKVSMVLGVFIAFPYLFWEFWRFIKPGLYPNEQKAIRGIVLICSFLFFLGITFGFFIIAPFAVTFLANYEIMGVTAQIQLVSLVNYMVMFTAPAGMIFELPVVVYFLSKIGLLTPEFMRKYRRHAVILILGLSALITPPDVVTQFLIGIPLYILYEISIGISSRIAKKYEEEA